MLNLKATTSEVIALLLPDAEAKQAATILMRETDGRMSLKTVASNTVLFRNALTTGCFRKGKPIIDPVSREIMGYEMEMVEPA